MRTSQTTQHLCSAALCEKSKLTEAMKEKNGLTVAPQKPRLEEFSSAVQMSASKKPTTSICIAVEEQQKNTLRPPFGRGGNKKKASWGKGRRMGIYQSGEGLRSCDWGRTRRGGETATLNNAKHEGFLKTGAKHELRGRGGICRAQHEKIKGKKKDVPNHRVGNRARGAWFWRK